MKITVEAILAKRPCLGWTEERLRTFIGNGKTLSECLRLRGVSDGDKIWCVSRFLPDKVNRKFAIWCARQCKTKLKEIKDFIDVTEKFYNGEATKEELILADKTACRKAFRTADWMAYNAAYNAAYSGAYWAAYNAVYSTSYSGAMFKKQLRKLKEIVQALEGGE